MAFLKLVLPKHSLTVYWGLKNNEEDFYEVINTNQEIETNEIISKVNIKSQSCIDSLCEYSV